MIQLSCQLLEQTASMPAACSSIELVLPLVQQIVPKKLIAHREKFSE